jgi:hypothetical protein
MTRSEQHRPDIAAHRLVGDGHGALLVRPDGEIDWWCAPHLDSTPLCWSLLDPCGGAARFPGVRYARRSDAPAGPTAVTVVASERGRVEIHDALLEDGHPSGAALVRLVRGLDADLDIVHELHLAGFGTGTGAWELRDGVAEGRVDGRCVLVSGGHGGTAACSNNVDGRTDDAAACTHGVDGRTLRSRLCAGRGRWAALVVRAGGHESPAEGAGTTLEIAGHRVRPPYPADELAAALDAARARYATWLGSCRPPSRHHQRAADAIAVLRACTYAPTGATVAALTTGLPEAPGHERQFDYRYSWLRDASLAVSVASLLGQRADAERYLRFVHSITGERVVPSGPLVDIRGRPVPAEREVPGVAGWAGSRPVRVGNAARDQVQYDTLGLLVEAVSVHVRAGSRLDRPTWRLVRDVADLVAGSDPDEPQPSNGIWEFREPGLLVDADIGRWLALDRAIRLGRRHRPWRPRRRWIAARDRIAARVRAAITADGMLPQAYGQDPPRPDAAALMAVVFGLLSGEQARRLVHRTVEELEAYPFLYRYPPDGRDDFTGTEGAFLPVSFWAVTATALVGDLDAAAARMDDLCAGLPRLLAEEVDPANGSALGNVPLVWAHMELARALYTLDDAAKRRRVGRWIRRLGRRIGLRPPGG